MWDIVNKKGFMDYLYKNSERATLRLKQNSITVYGDTAKFIMQLQFVLYCLFLSP